MSKTFAVLDDSDSVRNIVIFDDDFSESEWDGSRVVEIPALEAVSIGWLYDSTGGFSPPPVHSLEAPLQIGVDETALVRYTNTHEGAPRDVTFSVNGSTVTVELTSGRAELELTPSGPGPILVSANQSVPDVTIDVSG